MASKPLCLMGLLLLLLPPLAAGQDQGQEFTPEQIRASFLYHIGYFGSLPQPLAEQPEVRFCFYEQPPFEHAGLFAKHNVQTLKNKPIRLVRVAELHALHQTGCYLLFVGAERQSERLFNTLAEQQLSMITIGENLEFIQQGGLMAIVPLQTKMKIYMSQRHYEASNLRFSSQLLKRAIFQ